MPNKPRKIFGPRVPDYGVLDDLVKRKIPGKGVPSLTIETILSKHGVTPNDDLISVLQDLSERRDFGIKDVIRQCSRNRITIPTQDKLREIIREIKEAKNKSTITVPQTITKPISITEQAPLQPRLVTPIALVKGIKFTQANFELPFDTGRVIGERLNTNVRNLLAKKDKELLTYLSQAYDPTLQHAMISGAPQYADLSIDDLVTRIKQGLLLARVDETKACDLDPSSKTFDRVSWYYVNLFKPTTKIIQEHIGKDTIPKSIVENLARETISHADINLLGFDINQVTNLPRDLSWNEFNRLTSILNTQVARQYGVFLEENAAIGIEVPALTTRRTTPCGLEVPVYRAFTLCGELPSASVLTGYILLDIETELLLEEYRKNFISWWQKYTTSKWDWPSLQEHPELIPYWLNMQIFGPLTLEEGEVLQREIILSEELWHIDSIAFAESTVPPTLRYWEDGFKGKKAKTLLKDDDSDKSYITDPFWYESNEISDAPGTQDDIGHIIIEVEGKLGGMQISPNPVYDLVDNLVGIIIPNVCYRTRITPSSLKVKARVLKLLSKEIFGNETLESHIWIPFVVENIKDQRAIEKCGEYLRNEVALNAHRTKFVTKTFS